MIKTQNQTKAKKKPKAVNRKNEIYMDIMEKAGSLFRVNVV